MVLSESITYLFFLFHGMNSRKKELPKGSMNDNNIVVGLRFETREAKATRGG
jgi:hypothetical protein